MLSSTKKLSQNTGIYHQLACFAAGLVYLEMTYPPAAPAPAPNSAVVVREGPVFVVTLVILWDPKMLLLL
jgi:hypothetical protein